MKYVADISYFLMDNFSLSTDLLHINQVRISLHLDSIFVAQKIYFDAIIWI